VRGSNPNLPGSSPVAPALAIARHRPSGRCQDRSRDRPPAPPDGTRGRSWPGSGTHDPLHEKRRRDDRDFRILPTKRASKVRTGLSGGASRIRTRGPTWLTWLTWLTSRTMVRVRIGKKVSSHRTRRCRSGHDPGSQVRSGLAAGGKRIRTSGPTLSEDAGAENIGKQTEDPARVAVVRCHPQPSDLLAEDARQGNRVRDRPE
jgi:hypothetical protein